MKHVKRILWVTLMGSLLSFGALSFSSPLTTGYTFECPAHIADCNYCPGDVLYGPDQCTDVNGRCRALGTCVTPDFYFYLCAGTPGPCN